MDRDQKPLWRLGPGIGQRAALIGALALFFIVAASELTLRSLSATVIGAVMAPLAAIGIYRTARTGIVIDQDGVTSRTIVWTQRIRWCDVTAVATAQDRRFAASVMLTTRRGRQLFLRGIARFATSAHVDRFDDIARYMEQVRNYHRARCAKCAEQAPPAGPALGDREDHPELAGAGR
jgi:hypothetical protein